MIKNRLAKLEKTLGDMHRVCRKCYGIPVTVVHKVYEIDPDGPGFRPTGDCYLMPPYDDVTDDLRCTDCGAPAVALSIMNFPEHIEGGRRVVLPTA